jgi:phenylpyruvate tautomerase
MPQLSLTTNVPVDAVVAADIIKDCSKALARIIGKPESVRAPHLLGGMPRPFSALLLLPSFC